MQTVKMADLLTHETKTWRLFLALYRDRLEQVPVGMDLDMLVSIVNTRTGILF